MVIGSDVLNVKQITKFLEYNSAVLYILGMREYLENLGGGGEI
jgi:hypothetical protein